MAIRVARPVTTVDVPLGSSAVVLVKEVPLRALGYCGTKPGLATVAF